MTANTALRTLTQLALDAFWQPLLAAFPIAQPTKPSAALADAAERAIVEWLTANGVTEEQLWDGVGLTPFHIEILRLSPLGRADEWGAFVDCVERERGGDELPDALDHLGTLGLLAPEDDSITDAGRALLQQLGVTW